MHGARSPRPRPHPRPHPPAERPQQQSEIELSITGRAGAPPKYAVPDFIALSPDAETQRGRQDDCGQVLWDDLDVRARVLPDSARHLRIDPAGALAVDDVPFDRWRELGADGLVIGTVQKTGNGLRIEVRLFNVRSRQAVFDRASTRGRRATRGSSPTPSPTRSTSSSARCKGVARTKLTFSSDRDRERVHGHRREPRREGDLHRRLRRREPAAHHREPGAEHHADVVARRHGRLPTRRTAADSRHLHLAHLSRARCQTPMAASGTQNWLPAWSPDGTQIAFTSSRDGNPELYVDEPRRIERAPHHEQPGHRHDADLVADGRADCVHVGPYRARRRST